MVFLHCDNAAMDGRELKKWRNELGYTQSEAAEAFGVNRGTFQNWESDAGPVSRLVELGCVELRRRFRRRLDFGPIFLIYVGDWMVQQPYGPDYIGLLQRERHCNTESALRRIIELQGGGGLAGTISAVIVTETDEIIWTGREIERECAKRKAAFR